MLDCCRLITGPIKALPVVVFNLYILLLSSFEILFFITLVEDITFFSFVDTEELARETYLLCIFFA